MAALLVALCALAGCKKKQTRPPRNLASLTPDQACKHFFSRVKTCAPSINRIKADKLELKGTHRKNFLRQLGEQVDRAFLNLDRLCERYAVKSRKQRTDMNKCYRARTCRAFGQCFVELADADLRGSMGVGPATLKEIRKQLQGLKRRPGRQPGGAPDGHMHAPADPNARTKSYPRPTPGTMSKSRPRP